MTTTYETDNYKSGVMEIRGVKRIWVYDKKTGHFAKLRDNTPIYSDNNTEQNLVDILESYGATIVVIVSIDYKKKHPVKGQRRIQCEAHITGEYQLKGDEFLVVKEIIENHIKADITIVDLTIHAINQYLGINGSSDIPFDTLEVSIDSHVVTDSVTVETFKTKLLMRGWEIECDDKEG